ncbi:MAG: aminotransferase class I/II-fold pyridoxal phosphate-dependent enzyme [Neisseriaceae bacterium]|nr:MAG: aminotransferase class I/II-fold pyridoxal phosphate-dependent enzyme [Neisseriaceae bacterium]
MSNKLKASATVLINTLAQSKKAAGIRVYNLSVGEPKMITPEVVRQGASKFIEVGDIPYPSPAGLNELRLAAANWMNQSYATDYKTEECIITTGGKFAIYLMLQYLCGSNSPLKANPTDKISVIIQAPYWVSYPSITKIMDATPVIINSTEAGGWKLTPEMLKAAYTPECKILMLNNGVNPTGIIYTRSEMQALLAAANKLGLLVISDEVYSALVYTDDEYVSCGSFPEYKDNVVVVQSASKSFAMTGWRVGFLFAKKDLIDVMSALSTQSTTGVSLICQHGALAAFKNAEKINAWVRDTMKIRRDIFVDSFRKHFGIQLEYPKATLYVFASLDSLGVKNLSDEDFCIRALEEANVATVPGSAFGQPGYVRFSYGADESDLDGGLENLAKFIKSLN